MAEILSMEPQKNFFEKIIITIKRAGNPKSFGMVALLAIVAAVPITAYLSQQNQDVRNRAQEEHPQQTQQKSVPDEILVKFSPGASAEAKQKITNEHALEVLETIPQIDVLRVKVNEQSKDKVLEALSHNPNVEFAEPNYLLEELDTPNDPYAQKTVQWNLHKISNPIAWDISKGDPGVVVALVDSGVFAAHEDLVGKIVPGYNCVKGTTDTFDGTGHGTVSAGIIGAITNNGIGVASVGRNVSVMPLVVVNPADGFTSLADMAKAVLYAAGCDTTGATTNCGVPRAKVITISLGGPAQSPTVQSAVNYAWEKGLVIAAASGNSASCCVFYPAAADNVIGVGASTGSDNKAGFSTIDDSDPTTPVKLDVLAPGQGIYSTNNQGGYDAYGGTSFASPHVGALAALILSANPTLTNQQVVDIITSTADDLTFTTGWDNETGYGRINAGRALAKATNNTTITIPDTTSPQIKITSPLQDATVSGTITFAADVRDNMGATKVEFYSAYYEQDGRETQRLIGQDTSAPSFSIPWNTTSVPNGQATIWVSAYDAAGNLGTVGRLTVTVNNSGSIPTAIPTPTSAPIFTPTPTLGITSLSITNMLVSNITSTSAKITWNTTGVTSTSKVLYSTDLNSVSTSSAYIENLTPTQNHAITLTGLSKATTYYYQVISQDAQGNVVKSTVARGTKFKTSR
jgi:thermitase